MLSSSAISLAIPPERDSLVDRIRAFEANPPRNGCPATSRAGGVVSVMGERGKTEREDFAAALNMDLQSSAAESGEVVSGFVVQITDEDVVIDVGLKSEGRIKLAEFASLGETVKVGDKIDVKVLSRETDDGTIRISRQRAAQDERWTTIQNAFKNAELVSGKVIGETKGGFKVDIGLPYPCFLPSSQASLKRRTSASEVVGQSMMFEIKEMDRRRKNIVLSRRAILEKEQEGERSKTLSGIALGAIIEGTVKNITGFGVFVDVGGIDGLITLGDLSWSGFIKDASTIVKKGDLVHVKVLEYDPVATPVRIRLGLKQAQGDPWQTVTDSVRPGAIIEGTVKSFTNFGAFVEVVPGVDGLVHISELSWTAHVKHPSNVVNIGDKVRVKIVGIDPEKKKISLSLKQATPDPWSQVYDEYPLGARVKGVITTVKDFGAFVRLPAGIEGRIHRSDLTWDENPPDPTEIVQSGQEVEVVVINIDPEQKRIGLSLKATTSDPWNDVTRQYQKNRIVEGTVTKITPEGAVVQLDEEGTEGFIALSDASRDKLTSLEGVLAVGQKVRAKVSKLERKGSRIYLSIRDLARDEELAAVKEYSGDKQSSSHTIADVMDPETAARLQALLTKPTN